MIILVFDRHNWILRTVQDHRQQANEVCAQVTKTARKDVASKYGVRYSILLSLPYFDPIKFCAIDVMHNLFLGTGKHMMSVWQDRNILSRQDILKIEGLVNKFTVPSDIGRLPTNISSGYGGFTANQWRSWIIIYSPVVLKHILPDDHLLCWLLFVRACSILCSRFIKKSDVNTADQLLLLFCRKCEMLYGPTVCTANFHLHLHLKQSFLDFGPPHAFWCFAFERFNGILGNYYTNKRAIEVQLMRRFCHEQAVKKLDLPPEILSLLHHNYSKCNTPDSDPASVFKMFSLGMDISLNNTEFFYTKESRVIVPLPPARRRILSAYLLDNLKVLYRQLYPSMSFPNVSPFYNHYGRVVLGGDGGDIIGSCLPGPNNKAASIVMAYWPKCGDFTSISGRMQVGEVQYFLEHETTIIVNGTESKKVLHVFAYVEWKQLHPNYDWFGTSATVCIDAFENSSSSNFIPVQRIACRCAHLLAPIEFPNIHETVFIASPIPIHYSL